MSAPTPIRVLIVEDDTDSSESLCLVLRHEGFEIVEAASVLEARAHLEARSGARQFDVVILDLGLPDFSPIVLAEEFRRLDPSPAIIIHSAAPDEIIHTAAALLGAVGQVRKPSNCRELVTLIRAAADRLLPVIR